MIKLKPINKLKIQPFVGIGNIKLGMSKTDIENIINTEFTPVELNQETIPAPYFNVEYNNKGEAIFIELNRDIHNKDLYPALFKDIDVFNTKAKNLIPQITKYYNYDESDWELGHSYIFPDIELALWRPSIFKESDMQEQWFLDMCEENQQDEIQHMYFSVVAVGVKGYYNSLNRSRDVMNIGSNKLINNCKVACESYCELKDFELDGEIADFMATKYDLKRPK